MSLFLFFFAGNLVDTLIIGFKIQCELLTEFEGLQASNTS